MPEYTCPPVAPAGCWLLADAHIDTIEHALMRRIADLEELLQLYQDQIVSDQRDDLIAALTAINPGLAARWLKQVRT